MARRPLQKLVRLDLRRPIWDRFYWVAPLAVIGTLDPDGRPDFAPKHMITPMGWQNFFGFVCTPRHATYANAVREGAFTVSMPRPDQVVIASLCAAPPCGAEAEDTPARPEIETLQTRAATRVKGHLLSQSAVFLECETHKVVDGFGDNSLVTGRIVAAHVAADALRTLERNGQDVIGAAPLLAYLHPDRFARVEHSFSFPFPSGFRR
ncbi:MAG: flavin reductase family protein [Gemmatimonadota bacterium]|nr:flavin reductase family protein [Gemmatimonadota bacterium]